MDTIKVSYYSLAINEKILLIKVELAALLYELCQSFKAVAAKINRTDNLTDK